MLNVTIRSPQRLVLERWVSSVRLPGAAGEFEVLGFHVPFVAALTLGRIWVENQRGSDPRGGQTPSVPPLQAFPIRGGLAWLASDRLMVVVEEITPKGVRPKGV